MFALKIFGVGTNQPVDKNGWHDAPLVGSGANVRLHVLALSKNALKTVIYKIESNLRKRNEADTWHENISTLCSEP